MTLINMNNRPMSNLDHLLSAMDRTGFGFHLTGSRFFGHAKPDSDYDFMAAHDSEIVNWLKKNGFKNISSDVYGDISIVEVYTHHFGVDVQLVKNIKTKLKAQEILNRTGCLKYIPKKYRGFLWSSVLLAIDMKG